MGRDSIPQSLPEARAAITTLLHGPDNIGIAFCTIDLSGPQGGELLAVFVRGLAGEDLVRSLILEPLRRCGGPEAGARPGTLDELARILPAPRLRTATGLSAVVESVLNGATALFCAGEAAALLIETGEPVTRPAGAAAGEDPHKDVFGHSLETNVALLRQRLRDPALVARPVALPRGRAGTAALVYLAGRAAPAVVSQVRDYMQRRGGEEASRRGLAAGVRGKFGLLPDLLSSRWPDRAAALLDAGYVVALIDRLPLAFIAPVTAPALFYGPLDDVLVRPLSGALRVLRLTVTLVITLLPALVVGLMNYHQEMMPSPFLLSLAAVREQAPFPIVLEVLFLEIFQELTREVGFHLPGRVTPGSALVAGALLVTVLTQAGVVGSLPGAVSLGVAFAGLGLVGYEVLYLTRVWRFAFIAAAGVFGFFGIAAVLVLFVAYLTRAESFGVPFLGETGLRFTSPGRVSSRRVGGRLRA